MINRSFGPIVAAGVACCLLQHAKQFLPHLRRHCERLVNLDLTLLVLFARFGDLISLSEPATVLPIVAASLYIPVYLYKAMRRVYGQGHTVTFAKYVALSVTYSIGATMTMLGALLFALISV